MMPKDGRGFGFEKNVHNVVGIPLANYWIHKVVAFATLGGLELHGCHVMDFKNWSRKLWFFSLHNPFVWLLASCFACFLQFFFVQTLFYVLFFLSFFCP
jgi:hypothetical protein